MKRTMITVMLLACALITCAQINFEKDNWSAIVQSIKQHKAEQYLKGKKYFFFLVSANWCNPCKMFDLDVKNSVETCELYNKNFCNMREQMGNIPDEVTPQKIQEQLNLNFDTNYPLCIYMNHKGEVVHAIVTTSQSEFLKQGKDVLAGKGNNGKIK